MDHFPVYLTSKLPNTGTSIFSIMSGLANTYNALNLSQGFPDFVGYANLGILIVRVRRVNGSGSNGLG